jgi:YVTN family beta-propeller protein
MFLVLGALGFTKPIFAAPFAYIANSLDNTVSVIDEASSTVIKTIGVGTAPHGVAINPAGTKAYISNYESSNVSVIDVASQTLINNITVGTHPNFLAGNSAGTRLYVGNQDSDNVYVIDMTSDTAIGTISIGDEVGGIAISLDNSKAYVVDSNNDRVRIVNLVNDANTITKDVSVGVDPVGVIISPVGDKVYISNTYGGADGTVSVIDVATDTVSGSIAVGKNPYSMAINEDGTRLYVANLLSGSISVVDTSIRSVISTFTIGTMPMGIDFNSTEDGLLVVDYAGNKVYEINSSTGALLNTIAVGNGPVSFYNFVTPTPATPTPEPTTVEIQQQNLVDGKRVKLKKALKKQTIEGQDLKLYFKKLPTKLTKGSKYYMKWKKNTKYPKGITKVKKTAMKKVWKLNTNLKKYKAKTKKQNYKIKVTVQYTDNELKAMKKEAKKKGGKVKEDELLLVAKVIGNDGKWFWTPVTSIWTDVVLNHSVENNTISFEFTKKSKNSVLTNLPNEANFAIIDSGYSGVGEGIGGADSQVNAFAVYDGDLYAGGKFTSIGGVRMNNIARWDGTSWTAVGNARRVGVNDRVDSLQVYDGDLYVGGKFTEAGSGISVNHLAKWNGRWSGVVSRNSTLDLPDNIYTINEMEVYNNELDVVTSEHDPCNSNLYRWDNEFFRVVGLSSSTNFPSYGCGDITSLETYNNQLYIAENFISNIFPYDAFEPYVFKWDGQNVTNFTLPDAHVYVRYNIVLKSWNGKLYITRSEPGGYRYFDINEFDGHNFQEIRGPFYLSVTGSVSCFEGYGHKLYVGGDMNTAHFSHGVFEGAENGIMSWNSSYGWDSSWSSVGYGLWRDDNRIPVVNAMISYDGYLFMGGKFTGSGGLDFNNIAKYRAID